MLRYRSIVVITTAMAFLLAPALTAASPPADPPAAGWSCSPAGSLVEARSDHTATLLPDGRVLIIGGDRGRQRLDSAEIWNPASGESSLTGSMTEGRASHTATLLPDGRVLVVGGKGDPDGYGENNLASAEIWDRVSGEFAPTGSMADSRYAHQATLLADGRVLITGGILLSVAILRSAELWDPATETWTPTGSLAQWRVDHTATLLEDGRVLVVGGVSFTADGLETSALAELWDPANGSFAPAGRLADPRIGHAATRLPDGPVLVLGGTLAELRGPQPYREPTDPLLRPSRFDLRHRPLFHPLLRPSAFDQRPRSRGYRREPLASVEVWDPAARSFERAGWLGHTLGRTRAGLLPDGRVFVVGDITDTNLELTMPPAVAEVWDPRTAASSPGGTLSGLRGGQTVTILPDGRALLVGGFGDAGFRLPTTEVCGPDATTDRAGAPPSAAPAHAVADPAAPATFTFRLEPIGEPSMSQEAGLAAFPDWTTMMVRATDPRAAGLMTISVDSELVEVDDGVVLTKAMRERLTNDGGAWSGTGRLVVTATERGYVAAAMDVLTGEGGYEGLTLIMGRFEDVGMESHWGVIVPSDQVPVMPRPPEPPAE
ncbi:MAG: kelch repeat-containing protein [Chloroflexota bacterium]|jgi:hypothetical protein